MINHCYVSLRLLLFLGMSANLFLFGQGPVQIIEDENRTVITGASYRTLSRAASPDTLNISTNAPFFDDFSYESILPDSNRWFLADGDFEAPYVNQHRAVNPPTLGVASFDGLNRFNEPYATGQISTGLCDRLTTHYIDLSSYNAADDIWLSFAIQPAGKTNSPESLDTFSVYIYLAETDVQERVFVQNGSDLKEFKQVMVPINKSEYFQTRFQVIFESWGSQNGAFDQWHLDYVYMAPGRSASDSLFNDLAPTEVLELPLAPYTAIPLQHYIPTDGFMRQFSVRFQNLDGTNKTSVIGAEINDPVGGAVFGGVDFQDQVLGISAKNRMSLFWSPFSEQSFTSNGAFELTVSIPTADDNVPENNTLVERYPIDSLFAYDDGEADAGFGLNKPWGFGNRFIIDGEDSLEAVWISFQPYVNFNQITTQTNYLEETSFRLTVWKDPHPDSILVQQIANSKVLYGDNPDHFERYVFTNPVPVSDTFWVGIIQNTTDAIGVGLDRQYPGNDLVWGDVGGTWEALNLNGVLMIRPEVQNGEGQEPASIGFDKRDAYTDLRTYPNPLNGQELFIDNFGTQALIQYEGLLMDSQGRIVHRFEKAYLQGTARFELPPALPTGIYFLRHQTKEGQYLFTEKLIQL